MDLILNKRRCILDPDWETGVSVWHRRFGSGIKIAVFGLGVVAHSSTLYYPPNGGGRGFSRYIRLGRGWLVFAIWPW